MKVFIFLSVCISFALGCTNLPELAACNRPGSPDCSCEPGLSCVLTKNLIYQGNVMPVKQCMPEGVDIVVETVDLDNQSADEPMLRKKRFLFNNGILGIGRRCAQETDCNENQCCLFGRRCAPKLLKYMTCYLSAFHKCGCRDGLTCTETMSVTTPITGKKISLRQCM